MRILNKIRKYSRLQNNFLLRVWVHQPVSKKPIMILLSVLKFLISVLGIPRKSHDLVVWSWCNVFGNTDTTPSLSASPCKYIYNIKEMIITAILKVENLGVNFHNVRTWYSLHFTGQEPGCEPIKALSIAVYFGFSCYFLTAKLKPNIITLHHACE